MSSLAPMSPDQAFANLYTYKTYQETPPPEVYFYGIRRNKFILIKNADSFLTRIWNFVLQIFRFQKAADTNTREDLLNASRASMSTEEAVRVVTIIPNPKTSNHLYFSYEQMKAEVDPLYKTIEDLKAQLKQEAKEFGDYKTKTQPLWDSGQDIVKNEEVIKNQSAKIKELAEQIIPLETLAKEAKELEAKAEKHNQEIKALESARGKLLSRELKLLGSNPNLLEDFIRLLRHTNNKNLCTKIHEGISYGSGSLHRSDSSQSKKFSHED